MLKKNGKWQLAPAYDVCYSYDPTNVWVNQHTLSINGKHKDLAKADLMTIAKANSIKKGEKIIDEIKEVVSHWPHYADRVKVSAALKNRINDNLVAHRFKT